MDNRTIPNICRACLSETVDFKSVFVSDDNSGYTIHLSEMIMACASVQITFGDGLPEQICVSCAEQTKNMYLFKLKCEESDKILRERLQEICNVREEKYAEYLEMNDCNETDVNVTVKSEIIIDECHERDPSAEEMEVFNEMENDSSSDSECAVLELCKKELKCEFCYKTFSIQSALNRHVKSHPAIEEFECDTCYKRFSQNDLLLQHKITHEKTMEFGDFSVNNDFEDDTIIIKTETTELDACPEGSAPVVEKEEMEMKHVPQRSKVSSKISCHVCMKKFSNKTVLNRHLRIHSRPHVCSVCHKGFFQSEQLTNHMRLHSGVKRHICDICLKGFNHPAGFKKHMRIHNGEKPFLCSTCHKGFNQLGNLRQHMDRHNGIKTRWCSTCDKGFATQYELSSHIRMHTGERPFVCPICSHSFKTSSALTTHKRIHSGEKPFECDVCKMKFAAASSLKYHESTHTEEKPYICDVCEQAFRHSRSMRRHKKTHLKSVGIAGTEVHGGGGGGGGNGGFLE